MCTCCVVRGSTKDAPDDPETEEVNDLEVIVTTEATSMTHTNTSNLTSATSVLDLEYRPVAQLRAIAIVLLLFIMTWISGSFAVSLPFAHIIPHQEIIFNYMYGIFSAALGIFILVFYCLGRSDMREGWKRCCCCEQQKLDDSASSTENMVHLNGHVVHSTNSLSSSYTNKSNNASKINGNNTHNGANKPTNVNLISSHTGTFSDPSLSSVQEYNFYNPRQNGVAKKYWEKNKRNRLLNQLKNELQTDSGHSSQAINETKVPNNRQNRNSSGSGSGGQGTHLSVEIQIQPRSGLLRSRSPSSEPQFDGWDAMMASQHQPLLNPTALQVDRYMLRSTVSPSQFPPPDGVSSSHVTSGQTSPEPDEKTSILPANTKPVLPPKPQVNAIPLQSVSGEANSHTLPKSTKGSPSPVNEFMQRNGSVPRLRDFDGQSSVSQSTHPPQSVCSDKSNPQHDNVHWFPTTFQQPKPPQQLTMGPTHLLTGHHVRTQEIFIDCPKEFVPLENSGSAERNANAGKPNTSLMQSRTPLEGTSQPTLHEDPPSQLRNINMTPNPKSQHRSRKKRHSRSKPKPKRWEEEFIDRQPQPVTYAYVDHDYKKKVVDELLRQPREEGETLKWLHETVSECDQSMGTK